MPVRTVLVTGAAGYVASYVLGQLKDAGLSTIAVGRRPSKNMRAKQLDSWTGITCTELKVQPDAIIHLAAEIPGRSASTPHGLFTNNIVSTRNVLDYALRAGIRKIVNASSESVLGLAYASAHSTFQPEDYLHYLPIDEEHPTNPTDPYSLSKLMGEYLCDRYAAVEPVMSITSLRFAWILDQSTYNTKLVQAQNDSARGLSKLFSYVDARDVARACVAALRYEARGHQRFFIAAEDTISRDSTFELAQRYFSKVRFRLSEENGFQSLISSDKAKTKLGYQPAHSWRDAST